MRANDIYGIQMKPTQLWCRHFDCFWYLNEKWPKNDWNTTKKWL